MSELEELQQKVRKLNSRAGNAKMELHDLAEDLPINWTDIRWSLSAPMPSLPNWKQPRPI